MTSLSTRPRVVVLGMMSRTPVPGVIWQTMHYLLGLERLGCDVWYVEDHGMTPTAFFSDAGGDGWERAAAFIDRMMSEFGLGGKWAYHAEHGGGRHFGLSASELHRLYRSSALVLNLHGATRPRAEHAELGRLILVETDPVELEVQLAAGDPAAVEYAGAHNAFFTFGENVGRAECALPPTPGFEFLPTRQPVVLELWDLIGAATRPAFTTIGNWRQHHRSISLAGDTYHWSKHLEFLQFLDLPERTGHAFELALASCETQDLALLARNGWNTRAPFLSADAWEDYRRFIGSSYGEFTVAKDQNIRLRTGWFSDRSATYLAAGRPVITQDTGFSSVLPTGKGLFSFATPDDAAAAVDEIRSNYPLHQRAAHDIARECFSSDVVLGDLLGRLSVTTRTTGSGLRFHGLPAGLDLEPVTRRPLTLLDTTSAQVEARLRARMRQAEPLRPPAEPSVEPEVTIVIAVCDGALYTTMCLESLLAGTGEPTFEIVVVNNGSRDETPALLDAYQRLDRRVRVISNRTNRGFAAANNQGIAAARGRVVVLLNNDTIVTSGWLSPILAPLDEPGVGLVGPTTNRTCNEAQVSAKYRTVAQLEAFATARRETHSGRRTKMRMLAMFCVAGRRDTFAAIGPLDEQFEIGMFEDDDYAVRARTAGHELACAEDAFVHHFAQATIGSVLTTEEYQQLFERNRERFDAKWNRSWQPHERRESADYALARKRVCRVIEATVPIGATVAVAAKGDDAFLDFAGRTGVHFPGKPDGTFLGEYPSDSASAVALLDQSRDAGADHIAFPAVSAWWFEHYAGLRAYLDATFGPPIAATPELTVWSLAEQASADREAEVTSLRRIVLEQVDLLERTRAELSTLRDATFGNLPADEPAGAPEGATTPAGGADRAILASLRETWDVLDRALTEGDFSKHVRYLLLRARLRAQVLELTAPGSTIAIVSHGDDALVSMPDRIGWHVPRLADGSWSAGLPADGAEAVRQIEILRAFGADYLVLPATYGWWLDTYDELAEHLATKSAALAADPDVGFIWDLCADTTGDGTLSLDAAIATSRVSVGGEGPTVLDWNTGFDLRSRFPELAVFSPPEVVTVLPYLDGTVDIVAVGPGSEAALDEARRVASVAVVQLPAAGEIPRCRVIWTSEGSDSTVSVTIVAPTQEAPGPTFDAILRSLPESFTGEVLAPGYAIDTGRNSEANVVRRVPPEASAVAWARAASASARSDIVVFVDALVVPLRGWIEAIVANLGPASAAGAVTGVTVGSGADSSSGPELLLDTSAVLAVRRELLAEGLPPADCVADACAALAESLRRAGARVISARDVVSVRTDMNDKR